MIPIIFAIIALLAPSISMAGWSFDEYQSGAQWSVTDDVKWYTDESSLESSTAVLPPDEGWYRSGSAFTVPSSWPDWAKVRFSFLSSGLQDDDRKFIDTWKAPGLDISTPWIDAKADKNSGSIQVSIPEFQHFTYVMIDPPTGIVDQDFKGSAKIYGLGDNQTYRIIAWDSMNLIGISDTAISDKYIHVLPDSYDNLNGRVPVMGQKVIEDPNRDLWASVYQPAGFGALFQFIDIYSLTAEGDIRSRFRVPLTASYLRPWLSDLILEDNGDLTFAASEDPMGLTSFLGPSYVARLEKIGVTVWETPAGQLSSAICIAPLGDGGYVYGGSTFSTDPLYLDKQFGRLSRLTSTGGTTNFGLSGTTYVNAVYSVRDIKRSNEQYNYSAYSGTTYFADLTSELGSCSDVHATPCADAFDDNNDTFALDTIPYAAYEERTSVVWDFGAKTGVSNVAGYVGCVNVNGTVKIEGSDDGISYSLIHSFYLYEGGQTFDQNVAVNYRYYSVTFTVNNWTSCCPSGYFRVRELSLNTERLTPSGSGGTDNYVYIAGRNNTGGPRLFSAIQTEGCPSSAYSVDDSPSDDVKCCEDMDGNLSGHGFAGEGGCMVTLVGCGWNRGSNQTATKSKVWYRTTEASTITLQYNDGAWQTIGSVAATADGATHCWELSFAAVTATNWRVTFSTEIGGIPCAPWLEEWQLYPASTGGGVVAKYVLSGVTGGTEVWNTKYIHPESNAGIFNAVVISPRDTSRIYGFGSTENSTVNLSLNKGMAICVDPSGVSIWQKDYTEVSEFYDASPTEDGGFLLAGTIYTGTSVQARSAVIMKIDKDGNVDTKFPQTFKDPTQIGNDGRGIIETRDKGILMIGGSSDPANRSQPYFVKLDRFYRPCSSGAPCE